MGAFSFKERFVEPVLAGLQRKKGGKRQTIRNFRKRPLKVGERVVLYYAQRTKWRRRLGEDVIKSVDVVHIHKDFIQVVNDGKILAVYNSKKELNAFARDDGFKDFEDMKEFWQAEHGQRSVVGKKSLVHSPFPYSGNLYKW